MTLKEIERRLRALKAKGYVPTVRKGSARRDSDSLITLFCFNRGVWHISQKDLIERYGYVDNSGRNAFKNTVYAGRQISQGLSLLLDDLENKVSLIDRNGNLLATWDVFVMVGKLMSKLSRVLFVIAERRLDADGEEEFLYGEAHILTDPIPRNFISAFKAGKVGIDLRMHLKEKGSVRNRGTAFRIKEIDLRNLYSNVRNLGI